MRAPGSSRSARVPSSSSTPCSSYHAGGPEGDGLLLGRPGQHALGERRAVVGRLGLGADDPHRPLVAAAAQGLGAALRRRGRRRRSRLLVVSPSSRLLQDRGRDGRPPRSAGSAASRPRALPPSLLLGPGRRARGRRRGRRSSGVVSDHPPAEPDGARRRCRRRARGPGRAGRRPPSPGAPCARAWRRSACGRSS